MKKLLILFFLLFKIGFSQNHTNHYIPDSLFLNNRNYQEKIAATCASPNGTMNSTSITPPSYAWLQTNGYCHPSSYGSSGTVCWSFIPTGNSITINSGYSSSGCIIIGFGPFTLYTCAPTCINKGIGLNFTVTPGQCYTWCMSYSGNGGSCSFNDFCPYFQQNTILPVEISYFVGSNQGDLNILVWKTESEKNSKYFIIESSEDFNDWKTIGQVKSEGKPTNYKFEIINFNKIINYYRLKQIDSDNSYKYYGIILINNTNENIKKIIKIVNILGQEVNKNYNGLIYIIYDNGEVTKQYNYEENQN